MRNICAGATALFIIIFSVACNKGSDEPASGGGKGGNATLRVTARHHSRVIDTCMVYIKYGSKDLAAAYDDSAMVSTDAGERVAIFSGLTTGSYYLLGRGWDPVIADSVTGGLPIEIKEEKIHAISLPVSDGD
jgi:hypothetical protein